MWPNPQETADLFLFTKEILNEKLHFLWSKISIIIFDSLTPSWRWSISYRNQSIDLLWKSMAWFLCDIDIRHERVKRNSYLSLKVKLSFVKLCLPNTSNAYEYNNLNLYNLECLLYWSLRKKCPYLEFSGPYFPAFGLNTERYRVSWENKDQTNSEYGHFLRSGCPLQWQIGSFQFKKADLFFLKVGEDSTKQGSRYWIIQVIAKHKGHLYITFKNLHGSGTTLTKINFRERIFSWFHED